MHLRMHTHMHTRSLWRMTWQRSSLDPACLIVWRYIPSACTRSFHWASQTEHLFSSGYNCRTIQRWAMRLGRTSSLASCTQLYRSVIQHHYPAMGPYRTSVCLSVFFPFGFLWNIWGEKKCHVPSDVIIWSVQHIGWCARGLTGVVNLFMGCNRLRNLFDTRLWCNVLQVTRSIWPFTVIVPYRAASPIYRWREWDLRTYLIFSYVMSLTSVTTGNISEPEQPDACHPPPAVYRSHLPLWTIGWGECIQCATIRTLTGRYIEAPHVNWFFFFQT